MVVLALTQYHVQCETDMILSLQGCQPTGCSNSTYVTEWLKSGFQASKQKLVCNFCARNWIEKDQRYLSEPSVCTRTSRETFKLTRQRREWLAQHCSN